MSEFAPYFGFLMASLIGLGMSLGTLYLARKSGLGDVQESLISTIQENSVALNERVNLLEKQLDEERKLTAELRGKVRTLEKTVISLAAENAQLKKALPCEEPPHG